MELLPEAMSCRTPTSIDGEWDECLRYGREGWHRGVGIDHPVRVVDGPAATAGDGNGRRSRGLCSRLTHHDPPEDGVAGLNRSDRALRVV